MRKLSEVMATACKGKDLGIMKKSGPATVFALAAAFALGGCVAPDHATFDNTGSTAATAHRIDAVMPDYAVSAGISPDTHKAMHTTAADAPGFRTWAAAMAFCATEGGRVPTTGELNVVFQNRAAIGGFNETGSDPAGWYWSSSQDVYSFAWVQRFSDGYQTSNYKGLDSSLRCVR